MSKHIAEQFNLPFGSEVVGKGKKRKVLLPRFRMVETVYLDLGRHTLSEAKRVFAVVNELTVGRLRLEMWDQPNKRWLEVQTPDLTK